MEGSNSWRLHRCKQRARWRTVVAVALAIIVGVNVGLFIHLASLSSVLDPDPPFAPGTNLPPTSPFHSCSPTLHTSFLFTRAFILLRRCRRSGRAAIPCGCVLTRVENCTHAQCLTHDVPGTYNIWNHNNYWDVRKLRIAEVIRDAQLDIVGLQVHSPSSQH